MKTTRTASALYVSGLASFLAQRCSTAPRRGAVPTADVRESRLETVREPRRPLRVAAAGR